MLLCRWCWYGSILHRLLWFIYNRDVVVLFSRCRLRRTAKLSQLPGTVVPFRWLIDRCRVMLLGHWLWNTNLTLRTSRELSQLPGTVISSQLRLDTFCSGLRDLVRHVRWREEWRYVVLSVPVHVGKSRIDIRACPAGWYFPIPVAHKISLRFLVLCSRTVMLMPVTGAMWRLFESVIAHAVVFVDLIRVGSLSPCSCSHRSHGKGAVQLRIRRKEVQL